MNSIIFYFLCTFIGLLLVLTFFSVSAADNNENVEKSEKETEQEVHHAGHPDVNKLEELRQKITTVTWVTREMADALGREYVLLTTLKDTIYFLIFLVIATTINMGALDTSMFHFFKGLHDQLLEKNNFDEVRSASGVWAFLENVFETSFYWDYWYFPDYQIRAARSEDRNLFYENKLVGVPRLRQLKVRADSCMIHYYFKRSFVNCYGPFSSSNEDREPFGPGTGTAWQFSSKSDDDSYWGKLAWYHGGGYYQDLTLQKIKTLELIEELKGNLWITRGTRAIFLDFSVYNINLNIFAVIRAVFEFAPTGTVIPSSKIHIVKLLRYTSAYDYFILGCELVLILYIFYYTFEEVREIHYFRWKYVRRFWSYVDIIIISLGYLSFVYGVYSHILTHTNIQRHMLDPNSYLNLDRISYFEITYRKMLAIQLFFIYLKIFKYLNFNKNMAQLNNTLTQCRKDMLGFAIMFFVIFVAFAMLGYLLFGIEVEEFSSCGVAMFTLLRTILGDFDYTNIERANRFLAPVFFLCFIFLVFFVLLNMFLAIINDTYTDVKTEMAIAPQELRMGGFLKRGYYNVLIKMGLQRFIVETKVEKNEYEITASEIRIALAKLGFSNLEIEMFFARFNIDPAAQIQQYDIETLTQVLHGKIDPPRMLFVAWIATASLINMHVTAPKFAERPKRDEYGKPLFAIDDFHKQQEKLEEIEKSIITATTTLNNLIAKLDSLEHVRKIKRPEDGNENDR